LIRLGRFLIQFVQQTDQLFLIDVTGGVLGFIPTKVRNAT
jgi:hypothetical protein